MPWPWRGTIVYVDVGLTACVQNAVNFLMSRIEWETEEVGGGCVGIGSAIRTFFEGGRDRQIRSVELPAEGRRVRPKIGLRDHTRYRYYLRITQKMKGGRKFSWSYRLPLK